MSVFVLLLLLGFELDEDDELEGLVEEELDGELLFIELLVSVLLPVVDDELEGVVL